MGKHDVGRAKEHMSVRKDRGSRRNVPCDHCIVGVHFGSPTRWARGEIQMTVFAVCPEAFLC